MKNVYRFILFYCFTFWASECSLASSLSPAAHVLTVPADISTFSRNEGGNFNLLYQEEKSLFSSRKSYAVIDHAHMNNENQVITLNLQKPGSYKITWNVPGGDPEDVGAFTCQKQGTVKVYTNQSKHGFTLLYEGEVEPTPRDAPDTPPIGLTVAHLRHQTSLDAGMS